MRYNEADWNKTRITKERNAIRNSVRSLVRGQEDYTNQATLALWTSLKRKMERRSRKKKEEVRGKGSNERELLSSLGKQVTESTHPRKQKIEK